MYTSATALNTACDPRVEAEDGRILHPCGLSASAVFTDEFAAVAEDGTEIELDESRDAICWSFDLRSYKNPSSAIMKENAAKVDFWLYGSKFEKALHMNKEGMQHSAQA